MDDRDDDNPLVRHFRDRIEANRKVMEMLGHPSRIRSLERDYLHVGALAQSRCWWDRHGIGRTLDRMDDMHVLKVEAMMRDAAHRFAHGLVRGHSVDCEGCAEMLARPEPGFRWPQRGDHDARAWISETPLHRALVAEIRRRGLTPLEKWQ